VVRLSALGQLRKRCKIDRVNHPMHHSSVRCAINVKGRYQPGITRFPKSHSLARSATLSGLTALPCPYESDQPASLTHVYCFNYLTKTVMTSIDLPSPRRLLHFAIFPFQVKWSNEKNLPECSELRPKGRIAVLPVEFRPGKRRILPGALADTVSQFQVDQPQTLKGWGNRAIIFYPDCATWDLVTRTASRTPAPREAPPIPRLPPTGELPHNDSFQIKQQHC
jgi:hypothetical protein